MDGITVNESILVELLVGWGITDERTHLNPKDFAKKKVDTPVLIRLHIVGVSWKGAVSVKPHY